MGRKDRALSLIPVDGIGQEQIVIADLKQELLCLSTMQKALIAAVLSITMTDLRHTDSLLIIMT